MSATFVVSGDVVTITFEWPSISIEKATNLVEYASMSIFERDPSQALTVSFNELTNQQKLDLVYVDVSRYVIRMARDKYADVAELAARAEAEDDIDLS